MRSWESGTDLEAVYLSAITIAELATWVARINRRDPRQGALMRSWFHDRLIGLFSGRILPVDTELAIRAGLVQVPDPPDYRYGCIAATALVRGLTVVTRNVADFAPMGVATLNPFS